MTARGAALAGVLLLACSSGGATADEIPQPSGLRTYDYRAPVPRSLDGARTVSTSEAADLWRQGIAVFIDVLPQAPRPKNLPTGTIWRDKPRYDIPGSLWLPDTGYGELASAMAAYLEAGLVRATAGDKGKPLVFYCLADCWMSWNAAKRALALGYTNVVWYPDGTDGWTFEGLPVAEAQPEPRPE
jgi:PQQ-dependent catabolism-associated CXXCW motif protein